MADMQDIATLAQPAPNQATTAIKVKAPKRILHFSDGTMEEYSTDEEDTTDAKTNEKQISVVHATWGPWMIHKALHAGNRVLAACDYVGESIAAFLGITTPKYSYELEQFKRMQEEKAKSEQDEKEVGGWMQDVHSAGSENIGLNSVAMQQQQPKSDNKH